MACNACGDNWALYGVNWTQAFHPSSWPNGFYTSSELRQYQVAVRCITPVSGGCGMYEGSIRWLWDVLRQYQVAVGCIKAVSGGCGMY